MELLGQILSALGIIALLGFLFFIVVVFRVIKKAGGLGAIRIGSATRIHLQNCENPGWKDKEQIELHSKEMLELGLKDLGAFSIDEMPTVKLKAFMNGTEGLFGIIYEVQGMGIWLDLVSYFENGDSITATSSRKGEPLKQRPGHDKVREASAGPKALYKLLTEKEKTQTRLKLEESKEEFKRVFEKAYADEIDWRNSLGGPDEEEMRGIARASGEVHSDEVYARALEIQRAKACAGLSIALSENYRKKHSITDDRWGELEQKTIFVHDKLPADLCLQELRNLASELSTEQEEILKNRNPREAFQILEAQLHGKLRKIDNLEQPLATDVYEISGSEK
ncbi:MAG: hypothetical protein K2X27_10375 [Candidatus Obscuribacterales bacterium]|nr:hypothetical protein [Candidatus Obscuribacterales bacterium]